MSETLI